MLHRAPPEVSGMLPGTGGASLSAVAPGGAPSKPRLAPADSLTRQSTPACVQGPTSRCHRHAANWCTPLCRSSSRSPTLAQAGAAAAPAGRGGHPFSWLHVHCEAREGSQRGQVGFWQSWGSMAELLQEIAESVSCHERLHSTRHVGRDTFATRQTALPVPQVSGSELRGPGERVA